MMKEALEKVTERGNEQNSDLPVWHWNEDIILKLCGLK
jgi:hypothetical protein